MRLEHREEALDRAKFTPLHTTDSVDWFLQKGRERPFETTTLRLHFYVVAEKDINLYFYQYNGDISRKQSMKKSLSYTSLSVV